MKKEFVINIVLMLAATLFFYASFSKYADWAQFENAMHKQPFSAWMVPVIMWGLPPIEILIALLLLYGIYNERIVKISLYAFEILMAFFTLYIAAILLNFFPWVPCSCGGVVQRLGWMQHLLFNLSFMIIGGIAIYLNRKRITAAGATAR